MATTQIKNSLNDQFCMLFCQQKRANGSTSQEERGVLRRPADEPDFHDPHGGPNELTEETHELMNKCLQELDTELKNIVQTKKGKKLLQKGTGFVGGPYSSPAWQISLLKVL
jgi:hypothetical protein